jgi:hypothetical protein
MSQERRKKQAEREQVGGARGTLMGRLLITLVIVAAFGGAFYFGIHKRNARLDAFAKCTAEHGAKMYGAFWCPHCQEQKEEFGSSFEYVNYIECGVKGDLHAQTPVCKAAGINHYPTWEFPDKTRIEGKESFQSLSDRTGCTLP